MASTFRSFGAATPVNTSGATIVCASQTITTGDLIAVGVAGTSASNPGVTSITDTIGNTYLLSIHETNGAGTDWVEIWYTHGSIGSNASNIVTVNYVGTPTFRRAGADAWSSTLGTYWTIDGTPGVALSSVTGFSCPAGTNTQAECLGFMMMSAQGTATYTIGGIQNLRMGQSTDTIMVDESLASTGSQSIGGTSTTTALKWMCASLFKAGTAPTTIRGLSSLGAGS